MLFNSLEFILFLPIVLVLYFLTPHKVKWGLLLAVSFLFYSFWKPEYLILIITSIIVDYFAAIRIEKTDNLKLKRFFLTVSLVTNLGMLFTFKYLKFFLVNLGVVIPSLYPTPDSPVMKILLPVGISFYTFQTMGYTIDVYKGKLKAERHLGYFALYVSYFPQLVAGPIERASHLLPQFKSINPIKAENLIIGFSRILWGFFKKVVIADRLALFADVIFANPTDYSGFPLIVGILFFTFQIYCDFSGYSDIAIGIAKVMGIDIIENFNIPYSSVNISEFWKRWHISLSSWFRDYLYFPLGGNKKGIPRTYFNLLLVFTLSGFWHGANWTFLVWGILHGIYLIFYKMTSHLFTRLPKQISIVITFIAVSFAWVFFRAKSLNDALYIIRNVFHSINWRGFVPGLTGTDLMLSIVFIAYMTVIHHRFNFNLSRLTDLKPYQQLLFLSITFCLIICFGIFNENKFLYFQF
ncbi:MAG: MBOAT family protein [Candidatus Cloacimonetes bacterium]|nr:MBOAT family protein [Candidatus Cloacimonadota bacterium]